jgi:hypothetical protein
MNKHTHLALGYLTPVKFALQWQQAEMASLAIPSGFVDLRPTLWEATTLQWTAQ